MLRRCVARGVRPNLGAGFTGQVAVGYDSLWAASDDQVVRADPEMGQPIETFPTLAAAIEASEGLVWVLAHPESSSPELFYRIKGRAALREIDPTDNRIVGQPVQIDDLQPIALAAGDGVLWVVDYGSAMVTRFALVPCSDPACTSTPSPQCVVGRAGNVHTVIRLSRASRNRFGWFWMTLVGPAVAGAFAAFSPFGSALDSPLPNRLANFAVFAVVWVAPLVFIFRHDNRHA